MGCRAIWVLLGRATFFIGKQSVSSFSLQSGPDVLTKRSVSFPSTPSPHAHCHFARLCPGPRSPAAAKARLSQEPEEGVWPLWGASMPATSSTSWASVSFLLEGRGRGRWVAGGALGGAETSWPYVLGDVLGWSRQNPTNELTVAYGLWTFLRHFSMPLGWFWSITRSKSATWENFRGRISEDRQAVSFGLSPLQVGQAPKWIMLLSRKPLHTYPLC